MGIITWLHDYSIIFMLMVFSAIVIAAYWPSRREEMHRYGTIPLNDDPAPHTRNRH